MKTVFESDRICFVEVSELLIKDYLIMINDYENVNRLIGSKEGKVYTEEDEEEWISGKLEEKAPVFSMIEKKSGEFIGNTELVFINDSVREFGISITAKKQNLGYGSEAVKAMTVYGFDTLKLKRIILRARPYNARAIHVYKKCGFKEYDRTDEHVYMEISG